MKYTSIFFFFLIYSCANIVLPTGGPKDVAPPQILKSEPRNNQLNFQESELVFSLNEFVDLVNPNKTVLISPYTKQKLDFSIIGKKFKIKFSEPLKKNTTYSIALNGALKDFNEGNLFPSSELIFSTGAYIDSGKFSLEVKEAKTNSFNNESVVILVKNEQDFKNQNYEFISKSKDGISSFPNLKNEKYIAFSFVDSNQNLIWEKNELVGFLDNEVYPNKTGEKIKLFKTKSLKPNFQVSSSSNFEYLIQVSEEIYNLNLSIPNSVLIQQNPRNYRLIVKDTIVEKEVKAIFNGSSTEMIKFSGVNKNLEINILKTDSRINLYRNDSAGLEFNSFIFKLDTSKIRVLKENKLVNANYLIEKNKIIFLNLEPNTEYNLKIDSFGIYNSSTSNKTILHNFSTYPQDQIYQNITVDLDPKLANKDAIIYQEINGSLYQISNKTSLKLNKTLGSELIFHIVLDLNKNGIWDSGNLDSKLQPEPYYIEKINLDKKMNMYKLNITKE